MGACRSKFVFEKCVSFREASKPTVDGARSADVLPKTVDVADCRHLSGAAAPIVEDDGFKLLLRN